MMPPFQPSEYLFVYGTLRKSAGSRYNLLQAYCHSMGDAWMQGKLYELGGYPGAVPSGYSEDKVHGELYAISDAEPLFLILDDYEQCSNNFATPHEYVRTQLPVWKIDTGKPVSAWVYVYNHEKSNPKHIESGNYLDYLRTSKG